MCAQRYPCGSALEGDDDGIERRHVSLVTPGGANTGSTSHLLHRATMLAVCVGAVTSLTCITHTRVDVIISLPHLLMLRTFNCVLKTRENKRSC